MEKNNFSNDFSITDPHFKLSLGLGIHVSMKLKYRGSLSEELP